MINILEQRDFLKTPSSYKEALHIQNCLRHYVLIKDKFPNPKTIAGLDVGYNLKTNEAKAALVIMDINDLKPIQHFVETMPADFPYIPGLLSFREVPVILKTLENIETYPDILFVDGQGIAHPRRLGIASHIGALLDIPTIGVAKSKLCGEYEEPSLTKGSSTTLYDKNEQIGTVLRSRNNVKPLFISPGHRVHFDSAVKLVERCLIRYRLPEPTRLADKLSKFSDLKPIF